MPDNQPPRVPTPPDGMDPESWRHGFQTACQFLAQQSMTVAKVQSQTHPPPDETDEDEDSDTCPECGGGLTDAFGGTYCTECGHHVRETPDD